MPKRAIGGKNLKSSFCGGLWEKKHSDAMGESVFLFGWLVHRQTAQRDGTGLVLRGKPLTYSDISADTGWPERTLQRWMATLQKGKYIDVKYTNYCRMVIRILRAKKFNPRQLELLAMAPIPSPPEVAPLPEAKSAKGGGDGLQNVADLPTKSGGLKERIEGLNSKKAGKQATPDDVLFSEPQFVPVGTWLGFVEMRKKSGRPLTNYAGELIRQKLKELKVQGHDPTEVLEQSIRNGWLDVFPIKQFTSRSTGKGVINADERTRENLRAAGLLN